MSHKVWRISSDIRICGWMSTLNTMLQITWQMKQNGNFVGPLKLTPCGSLSAGGMSQVRLASETRPTSGVKLHASPPSASWGTPVSSPSMAPVTTAADSASNGEFSISGGSCFMVAVNSLKHAF